MATDLEIKYAHVLFGESKRLNLYRRISSRLKNGVNLDETLDHMYRRASKDGKNPGEVDAIAIGEWLSRIRNGKPFSEAIEGWAPNSERMIVSAGEKSGFLAENLLSVCKVVESNSRMKMAILGSLVKPVMLLLAAIAVMMIFGLKVIPMFTKLSNPATWSGAAYSLYVVSNFVKSVWLWISLGIGAFVTAIMIISLPRLTGPLRVYLEYIPPWSIYKLFMGSSFIVALAALLKSGEPLQKSMMDLRRGANPWLAERLDGAMAGVRAGMNFGVALDRAGHKFPDVELIEDIVIYSNQGGFDDALDKIGREWLEEGVERVEKYAGILNGLATLAMGIVVAWIVYGVFGLQQAVTDSMQMMAR